MRTACSVVGGMNWGAGACGLSERELATAPSIALAAASTGADEAMGTTLAGWGTWGLVADGEEDDGGDDLEVEEEGPENSSGCESR